ncbi:MAG TPA: hypothetical protein ENJ19_01420 [Gammaproteobacteria bacterium]|nr:hypothetical protein [Gammaproteobacteria bacterium]
MTKLVPIQIARVSQTESYKQVFLFLEPPRDEAGPVSPDLPLPSIAQQNARMDEVFSRMMGAQNWQQLKDLYGVNELREELIQQRIYIKGFINFTIYIDPVQQDLFVLEGFGRYFLIREKTGAILLSGDFWVPADPHTLSELDQGHIVVRVDLFVSRMPNQVTHLSESAVKYKIFVDTSMREHAVYSVDYDKNHFVYLAQATEKANEVSTQPVAYMLLDRHGHEAKLLDLRGIGYLKNDYDAIVHEGRRRALSR